MSSSALLGPDAPVPLDRPFTRREVLRAGASPALLAGYVRDGLVVSPIRGALHVAQLPDGLDLRIACAKLVVPEDAVVTDRTAGWLHFAPMVLAPGDHERVPDVDFFCPPRHRLRRPSVRSGERGLLPQEVVQIDGLHVTSKLRTTCDLGMQLPRRQAFAGMCSMLKVADFTLDDIRRQADGRFKGYRWVTQLRTLRPHLDSRFQSPGECWTALCWLDEPGLPPFVPQYAVTGIRGSFYLDFAVPELRYAAEYDGMQWHGAEQAEHDAERRDFLREEGGWVIDVLTAEHVTGPRPRAGEILRDGIVRARRRLGQAAWSGQDASAGSASYGVTRAPGQRRMA